MGDREIHRVVIIGGGFGGLNAARALRKAPVDVTLIDARNFHLFQPLLYQVATGVFRPRTSRRRCGRSSSGSGIAPCFWATCRTLIWLAGACS